MVYLQQNSIISLIPRDNRYSNPSVCYPMFVSEQRVVVRCIGSRKLV